MPSVVSLPVRLLPSILSNMTADVRFCAYHRLIQKTAPYRGMVSDEPGRSALKDFDVWLSPAERRMRSAKPQRIGSSREMLAA
mmetsp:Transcript_10702/g.25232  ORF Transcript_10702/g.25232 Transcript_10702/m.25232 type:complete len:83 (+) Transcript_10702:273-521(+)